MKLFKPTLVAAFLFLFQSFIYGQQYEVAGIVIDSVSQDPLAYVSVFVPGSEFGTKTDEQGHFSIILEKAPNTMQITTIGFWSKKIYMSEVANPTNMIIKLIDQTNILKEVVVRSKKYSNKNNPAVDLIRLVVDHREENKIENKPFVEFDRYEKVEFALSNIKPGVKKKSYLKNFQFVFDNMDSTTFHDKPLLPMYLKEVVSKTYIRGNPQSRKDFINCEKQVTFGKYFDSDGIDDYIQNLYLNVNIYENNITLLTTEFLSPISNLAPTFYRFYVEDTVLLRNQKCIKLAFYPRGKSDLLFQGEMYIATDGSYAVKEISMLVNKEINLNWVKDLRIHQIFEKQSDNKLMLVEDFIGMDFGVSDSTIGVYGEKKTFYKNAIIGVGKPVDFYDGPATIYAPNALNCNDDTLTNQRFEPLSKSEKGIYRTMDSLQRSPAFNRVMRIVSLLSSGYYDLGKYEIGPINSFFSFNPIEGNRLRLNGRTTPAFSRTIFLQNSFTYGFRDQRWKYFIGLTFSFTNLKLNQFPINAITLTHQKDVGIPGQELQFIQEDNFLLSFKRDPNDKFIYHNVLEFNYLKEFENHFSYQFILNRTINEPTGALKYNKISYNDNEFNVKENINAEASVTLRYAPGEKFYQGKNYRRPIINRNPVLTFRFKAGFKDIVGGENEYQSIYFGIKKRIYWSFMGESDVVLEGSRLFGKVPYSQLLIPRANQSYAYQYNSYNLMNFLEFASDKYVSIIVDHHFNGFFFNKIPLLRKLGWREVISFKAFYGGLDADNNPDINKDLYLFPKNSKGESFTKTLERKPYIEASVGVNNVLKFFRIDLVKRLSYNDNEKVSPLGIRGTFKFDF